MALMDIFTGKNSDKDKRARPDKPDDMDILDKLHEEHEEVRELLGKLVESERAPERMKLLKAIKEALVPHTKAEEKVVYDAIIATRDKNAKIDGNEGYFEHAHADMALKRLGTIKPASSPEFTAAAKVLKELVEHHIREEESNVWSDVKKNFSADERIEMNRAFEAAKKRVRIPN
ncbi:MAG: hemerythrin domain-containing protein [Alphaproteobacteria bacterium]|nr:hemerythrin domain-containing protein [Alphaproteobacteria bacterium]